MNINKAFLSILCFVLLTAYNLNHSLVIANTKDIIPWFQKAVLIKSYQQSYDWVSPWEKRDIRTKSGIALVVDINHSESVQKRKTNKIKKLYLLTTADMVADATLIEVTRRDIPHPFTAKVYLIDYAANVALLSIDNIKFWKKLKPVLWNKVKSNNNSKIKDVSSLKIKSPEEWIFQFGKIEQMTIGYRSKNNAWFPQLKIIGFSSGNQGYPVIQDNETVGMILEFNSKVAKAIPTELILEFFKHAKNNTYTSLAHRGFNWKKLPQPSTADYLNIPNDKSGIWISRVFSFGTGSEVLHKGDYLTKIGKWAISNEGKIIHPTWGVSLFDLLFLDILKVGSFVNLHVIREGESIILNTKVDSFKEMGRRVPLEKVGFAPQYIINGGLLFQELTLNYLHMWGKNWESRAPMRLRLFLKQNKSVDIQSDHKIMINKNDVSEELNEPRVVLVTQVIPDQINIGYQNISNAVVLKINGHLIKNLNDVKDAFLDHNDNFHRIDFLPGSDRISVILPVKGLNESNKRIQNNFRIPKLQSLKQY